VAYVALHVFLHTVPYIALAALGIVLFKRHHTVATALVALGFGAVAVSNVAGALVSSEFSYIYSLHGDLAGAVGRFHGWVWTTTYWSGTIGIWVASMSLLWHVLGGRQGGESPNKRRSGP
jgi:hypothetical protein